MERVFAVVRSRGPAYDDSTPLEGQTGWTAHANVMDALYAEGVAALVGPLEGTRDALLILRASSISEVRERLASDPWIPRVLVAIAALTLAADVGFAQDKPGFLDPEASAIPCILGIGWVTPLAFLLSHVNVLRCAT